MSSRALRKAQKQREELALQKRVDDEVEENGDEKEALSQHATKPSLFALLNEDDDNDDHETEGNRSRNGPDTTATQTSDEEASDSVSNTIIPQQSTKRKKKKKKGKGKGQGHGMVTESNPTTNSSKNKNSGGALDEIDLALKSLSVTRGHNGTSDADSTKCYSGPESAEICQLLSIDTHHLNVANEMRRLFGRGVFAVDREEEAAALPMRRLPADEGGIPLSEAVSGKYSVLGPGLPAVLRRRNILHPGKEEWPRPVGEGLSMEIEVQDQGQGIVLYKFVHNAVYQRTQRQFRSCVDSFSADLVVAHLRHHPYHVATLLQVSEIAKHQKEYATSGDLLERALFSFGRALQSTFAAKLAQGKARLDFSRPENREFYLTCWRYIENISSRATWRTAYEWARLMLSLDNITDPYCIRLRIDQLAIRAKQADSFLKLCNNNWLKTEWEQLVNIQFSRSLAVKETGNVEEAKKILEKAISKYPWVARRLFEELNISHLPQQIWGKEPPDEAHALYCELYVTGAKDLWKSPEATAFLIRAVASSRPGEGDDHAPAFSITLNEARVAYLQANPAIIALVPGEYTKKPGTDVDPMPPNNSTLTYDPATGQLPTHSQQHGSVADQINARQATEELLQANPQRFVEEVRVFQHFFSIIVDGFTVPEDLDVTVAGETAESIADRLAASGNYEDMVEQQAARRGMSEVDLRAFLRRYLALYVALARQPGRRVTSPSGDVVSISDNTEDSREMQRLADEAMARALMEEELDDMDNEA